MDEIRHHHSPLHEDDVDTNAIREDDLFIRQEGDSNGGSVPCHEDGQIEKEAADFDAASILPSRCRTVVIYVSMTLTAFVLTLFCPETRLWNASSLRVSSLVRETSNHNGSGLSLDVEVLTELVAALFLVWISLWAVQGSNPGYLDSDIVDRAFRDVDEKMEEQNLLATIEPNTGSCSLAEEMVELVHPVGSARKRTSAGSSTRSSEAESAGGGIQTNENRELPFHTSLRRKRCSICSISPPLRSHHCRRCDRCVATFDHHCLFIGTCVGERNHCRFWWFLTFQLGGFLVCVGILSSSTLNFNLVMSSEGGSKWNDRVGASIFILAKLYIYPLTLLALVMWLTHTWIALSSTTTFECGKGHYLEYMRGTKAGDLPFSKGIDSNLRSFCCLRDSTWHWIMGAPEQQWTPAVWRPPGKIVRDSADWWEHPWENKYWSCC